MKTLWRAGNFARCSTNRSDRALAGFDSSFSNRLGRAFSGGSFIGTLLSTYFSASMVIRKPIVDWFVRKLYRALDSGSRPCSVAEQLRVSEGCVVIFTAGRTVEQLRLMVLG